MGGSNTRMWWRTRIKAIQDSAGEISAEDWLGELMKVPELKLAGIADSNPNYRLAVVARDTNWHHGDSYCVVKMERES